MKQDYGDAPIEPKYEQQMLAIAHMFLMNYLMEILRGLIEKLDLFY